MNPVAPCNRNLWFSDFLRKPTLRPPKTSFGTSRFRLWLAHEKKSWLKASPRNVDGCQAGPPPAASMSSIFVFCFFCFFLCSLFCFFCFVFVLFFLCFFCCVSVTNVPCGPAPRGFALLFSGPFSPLPCGPAPRGFALLHRARCCVYTS